ncbi:ABC transporter permease subunit [Methylobacterium organophilum]|nr:ABC transporter permease subunit [Methylobacterium organophilum]
MTVSIPRSEALGPEPVDRAVGQRLRGLRRARGLSLEAVASSTGLSIGFISQVEAALSIGMGWGMTMRRVILPQAIRIALPPYGNIMIMMLKDSSQASTITVAELALQGKLIASSTFKNTSVYTLVALMYLALSLPLILMVRHFEAKGRHR